MKKINIFAFIFSILVGLLSGCSYSGISSSFDESISVGLIADEYIDVTSQNPVKIKKGDNATFDITLLDGHVIADASDDYIYENGIISFNNIRFSKNIYLESRGDGYVHIKVINDDDKGVLNSNIETDDWVESGTKVELQITPIHNNKFTSWTIGDYETNVMPDNFERDYVFEATQDVTLYANYYSGPTYKSIHYFGNGGSTKSGDSEVFYDHTINNHTRINTAQGNRMFFRDGYLLESWNTKPDGNGERIGLGSRISMSDDESEIQLYAIWSKNTDNSFFEFENHDDYFAVKSCCSNEDTITVPSTYSGIPVTTILANAFDGLGMAKLLLPPSITSVEESAINNCNALRELLFSNTMKDISDKSLSGTTNIETVSINSYLPSKFAGTTYTNIWTDKADLIIDAPENTIFLAGNSNTLYSFSEEVLLDNLKFNFIGMGVQYAIGVQVEIETLYYYRKSRQNIIVFCPEFSTLSKTSNLTTNFYQAVEKNYDLLRILRLGNYGPISFTRPLDAYKEFIDLSNTSNSSFTIYSSGSDVGSHGLMKISPPAERHDEDWFASALTYNKNFFVNGGFSWISEFENVMINTRMCFSFCSYNYNSIEDLGYLYTDYEQSIRNSIDFEMISKIENYGFSGYYFINDNYHLIYDGAELRSLQFISDLRESSEFSDLVI